MGNQRPYGYNTPGYYSSPYGYGSGSGLTNYAFGSSTASSALTIAGIGLAASTLFRAPVTPGIGNAPAATGSFGFVEDPNSNVQNGAVSDAYGPNLPSGASAADESTISNGNANAADPTAQTPQQELIQGNPAPEYPSPDAGWSP